MVISLWGVLAMHRSGTGRFWRKLVACLAAYSIALQLALSGLGLSTFAASSAAAALPICSEHVPGPTDLPSHSTSNAWLCPCAAACMAGWSVLSDAPAIAAFAHTALPANLSDCGS